MLHFLKNGLVQAGPFFLWGNLLFYYDFCIKLNSNFMRFHKVFPLLYIYFLIAIIFFITSYYSVVQLINNLKKGILNSDWLTMMHLSFKCNISKNPRLFCSLVLSLYYLPNPSNYFLALINFHSNLCKILSTAVLLN